jgi:sucrose-6-phosphate hydrolase SacC (GH32 family)
VPLEDGRLRLHLLADRMSLEIFADHGRAYLPLKIAPPPAANSLEVLVRGGPAHLHSLEVHELVSIWSTQR